MMLAFASAEIAQGDQGRVATLFNWFIPGSATEFIGVKTVVYYPDLRPRMGNKHFVLGKTGDSNMLVVS